MRSILQATAVALLLGPAGPQLALAQPHGGPVRIGPVLQDLGLSAEQRDQLRVLREKQQPKMRAHRKEWHELQQKLGALDPRAENYRRSVRALADKRAQHARKGTLLHAEFRAGLAQILSEEQLQRMAEQRRDRRDRPLAPRRGMKAQAY